MTPETISLYDFFKEFPDEESARTHLENKRWGADQPTCGHCGCKDVAECKNLKPMPYRCRGCRKHFSVRTGTVLAESRLPLHKWLMAIYMMTTARKGIPSTQMAKQLGVTQKTAWFLSQRIRETWLTSEKSSGSHGQVDETYIGGKEKNKHATKKLRQGRGAVGKIAVVGMLDDNNQVVAKPVKNVSGRTLTGFIRQNLKEGSTVVTDSFKSYNHLFGYKHITVNHSAGEYVKDKAHTNGIESFWALLKRGYIGIFHYMSKKHLHRYVNEFSFRHNNVKLGTMEFINITISKMENKRLTYNELTNA